MDFIARGQSDSQSKQTRNTVDIRRMRAAPSRMRSAAAGTQAAAMCDTTRA